MNRLLVMSIVVSFLLGQDFGWEGRCVLGAENLQSGVGQLGSRSVEVDRYTRHIISREIKGVVSYPKTDLHVYHEVGTK